MSEENKPIEIEPDINTDAEQQPDVCLSLKGLDTEVTLPNLNSADLPIELVNVVLIVKSKVVLSEEETFHATAVFLAYLQEMQPTLWNKLRKAGTRSAGSAPSSKAGPKDRASTQNRLPPHPPPTASLGADHRLADPLPARLEAMPPQRMARRASRPQTIRQPRLRERMGAHPRNPARPHLQQLRRARRMVIHAHRRGNRALGPDGTRRPTQTQGIPAMGRPENRHVPPGEHGNPRRL